ncbi:MULTISPECIES: hypothetical protein [Paraburkholderia]|uniref:hypothetical protein n=1 Tax=Paraburkholderia TaxID=1822464 RepID=UPI000375965C|nr:MULTISPECIES: hypothetical protein [Paraburkholderia]MDH6147182.1 hypothetical protein [Paraburkholderia sp. WSM4179]
MDFDRAQQALEVAQAQCPKTDPREIDVWISAITRAREALLELQVTEDKAVAATQMFAEKRLAGWRHRGGHLAAVMFSRGFRGASR